MKNRSARHSVGFSMGERHARVKLQSCPIQDEPEGEVGFQHKMSLERMAC